MFKLLPLTLVLLAAPVAVSAQTYKVLHNFDCITGNAGAPALAGVIAQSPGGAMLTTSPHCANSTFPAEAFRIWPDGTLQVVHNFGVTDPVGGLTLAMDGKFYGTTQRGGPTAMGTVFKMTQNGSVTNLCQFKNGSDGARPWAPPIQSAGGDFFGTTYGTPSGGQQGDYGSVYRITKDGNFTVLHSFSQFAANPAGPLVQGTDSAFYGTTYRGGPGHYGTIFRVSSASDFKVLVNFNWTNGAYPYAGLTQASDGNFYGVAYEGGDANGDGVLFRMSPQGALTVLHTFTGGSDGANPVSGLVQASDGNLYGTNTAGGKYGYGVLFRATLAGVVVPLHDFNWNQETGIQPISLFQHTNGILYGIANAGGPNNQGVFFSLNAGLPKFVTYLPVYGKPGALVEILGQGFTSTSQVSFNGTLAAAPDVVSPTYLRVVVPSGATTGPITVTTSTGPLKSNKVYVVHQ